MGNTTTRATKHTTIVVVEDQQVLSGAIRSSVEGIDDLDVVGTALSLGDAVGVVGRLRPDVVLSDYRLGDGDVVDHLDELTAASPGSRVLVFTGWADESSLVRAMSGGASGFVEKTTSFEDLLHAIRRVAAGEVVVSPRLLPMLARRAAGTPGPADEAVLTPRELEVLDGLAAGRSTAEIADDLYLAKNTVRNHLSRLFDKLGVHSRLEAVWAGVDRGFIRFDPPTH